MAKYLVKASYTPEGLSGLRAEGGTSRRTAVELLAGSVGAQVESFYFAFGEDDVFVILDAPDDVSAAAISLAVNGSGAVHATVTTLLTAEQIDEAVKRTVAYRPPGK